MSSLKNYSLYLAFALVATNSAAFAAPQSEIKFSCVNSMFRDAKFELSDDYYLFIQDSSLRGTAELQLAVAAYLGVTKGDLKLIDVGLHIPKAEVACESPLAFVMDCTGKSKNANLTVKGHLYPSGAQISLSIPVAVNNFTLKSTLSNREPVRLNGAAVNIAIDQMNVDAIANVTLGKREVDIHWTPFFYQEESKGPSYCKRF